MEPFYRDEALTVWQGDCRAVLAALPAESVHVVVTSPPYWGLRDYGIEPGVWGGDPAHGHAWDDALVSRKDSATGKARWNHGTNGQGRIEPELVIDRRESVLGSFCSCGAWRGALGLEPSVGLYVEHVVDVFCEVRRVLRRDGTAWLNLGDSYATGNVSQRSNDHPTRRAHRRVVPVDVAARPLGVGLKAKDLVGVPWRVAFALQADGWYLRRDVIWAKPNPMPESVTDRPTSAHEYVFLLARSPRYFYDAEAVKEPATYGIPNAPASIASPYGQGFTRRALVGLTDEDAAPNRNLRSVWTIATQPYAGAHFATFPRKLVEPAVLAGSSERGVCPDCGAPWVRMVERETLAATPRGHDASHYRANLKPPQQSAIVARSSTTGWRPGCRHGGLPDDLEVIATPIGQGAGGAFHNARRTIGRGGPITARRGMDRERLADEGVRVMLRWQQRDLARQIRELEPSIRATLEAEVGAGPLSHYARGDRSGGRAIPADVLESWIDAGFLVWPEGGDPAAEALTPVPAVVLDPFAGSGTTGLVAQALGRRAVLIDVNGEYLMQAMARNRQLGLFMPPASTPAPAEAELAIAGRFEWEEAPGDA